MSQRRHRLNNFEVPEVIEALKLRLWYHLEEHKNLFEATIAFKAYYRLITHRRGYPSYPKPITWKVIEDYLGSTPFEMVPLIRTVAA